MVLFVVWSALAGGAVACGSDDEAGPTTAGEPGAEQTTATAEPASRPAPVEFAPMIGSFSCIGTEIVIRDDSFQIDFDRPREVNGVEFESVKGTWEVTGPSEIAVTLEDGTEIPMTYEVGPDPDGEWESFYGEFRAIVNGQPLDSTVTAGTSMAIFEIGDGVSTSCNYPGE